MRLTTLMIAFTLGVPGPAAAGVYGKIGGANLVGTMNFDLLPWPLTCPFTAGGALAIAPGDMTPLLRLGIGCTLFDGVESLARPRGRFGFDLNLDLGRGGISSGSSGYQHGVGPLLIGVGIGGAYEPAGAGTWIAVPELALPLRWQWRRGFSTALRLILHAELAVAPAATPHRLVIAAALDAF